MDVFLIPAGRRQHQLYCEVPEAPRADLAEPRQRGWRRRLFDSFSSVVTNVETARHKATERRATRAPRTFTRRAKDRVVCWLAEKIAEQRLLWHLRGQASATAWFPDDLAEQDASVELKRILRSDADRHRRWLIIDLACLLVAIVFSIVPGPNLLGYYFAFRVVGHYLSLGGARNGLARVRWEMRGSSALSDLRAVINLEPAVRRRHVEEVAERLRLQNLAAFVERVAVPWP
jgi:hypothetical protein